MAQDNKSIFNLGNLLRSFDISLDTLYICMRGAVTKKPQVSTLEIYCQFQQCVDTQCWNFNQKNIYFLFTKLF